MTKPRYGMTRQNAGHARRLDSDGAPVQRRGDQQCQECGCWVRNASRAHKTDDGLSCRGIREVAVTEVPPVAVPSKRGGRKFVADARPEPSRFARGLCHDCDAPVSGERWYCGKCSARRLRERR